MIHNIETGEMHPHMKRLEKFVIEHWPVCFSLPLIFQIRDICSILSSGQLRTLIVEAKSRGLKFVYALSPGQDIVFSSSCDLTLLKRKLRQVDDTGQIMTAAEEHGFMIWAFASLTPSFTTSPLPLQVSDLGCQAFAILFDDIDHSMCQADSEAFSSFAHAQVTVTNEIYRFLGEPPVFLFCPTGRERRSEKLSDLTCSFDCCCWRMTMRYTTVSLSL